MRRGGMRLACRGQATCSLDFYSWLASLLAVRWLCIVCLGRLGRCGWEKQTGIPEKNRTGEHQAVAKRRVPRVVEDRWSDGVVKKDCHDNANGIGQNDDRQEEEIVADAPNKRFGLQMDDEITDQQQGFQLLDAAAGICDDNLCRAWQGDGGQMIFNVDLE